MSFLHPHILWALAVPLLLAALTIVLRHRRSQGWRSLVSAAHEEELVTRRPAWASVLPPLFTLLALACAIVAAARPIAGYTDSSATSTGRNLIIALDISRSMETQDVSPSRLEEARAAAYELIDALPGDKIGLIVFAGEADLVVPLTYDHTALRDALEQVNRDWAGYGGTNFGQVLRKAMADFSRSAPDGSNALVILSDGEDTVGSSLTLAEEARKQHLLVITVGIGTAAGGPIPDPSGENGLWQDSQGKHVISKLDVDALRKFAEATGGDFFAMGTGADLGAFAREAAAKLDSHEEQFSGGKVPRDLFAPFACAALLLLLLGILLHTDWKAPRSALPALLLLLLSSGDLSAAPESEAVSAYAEGLTHMRGGEADKAREAFSRALLDEAPELQAAALYEIGNLNTQTTLEKLRALYSPNTSDGERATAGNPTPDALQSIVDQLRKDEDSYHDALRITPSLRAAQTNIDKVEKLIQVLEEEIERLRHQDKQENQNSQNQPDQQDKQDSQNPQDQPDQQDKQENQNPQDQPDQQDKQDNQNPQNQPDQQDKQEDQNPQDQPDQQDKQDSQNPQNQPDQQDKQDSQNPQNQPDRQDKQDNQPPQNQPDQQDKQNAPSPSDNREEARDHTATPASARELSDEEKARQRATSILQMHLDEEKGSPIPHFNDSTRPPQKDY